MGNRWGKIVQENPTIFGNHTEYTTPLLEFDYIDLEGELEQNNEIPFTSGYPQARYHFMKQLDGKLRVNNYAAPDNIGEFIKSVLGTHTVVAGGTGRQHTFKPDQAGTAWTCYDYNSDFTQYRKFLGCQATKLEIAGVARDVATFNWVAMYADEGLGTLGAITMGTLPSVRPFMFYDGAVTVEGAQAKAESFRTTVDVEIPADTQVVGYRDRQYLIKTTTGFTATVDVSQADWVNLQRYYGGTGLASPANDDEVVGCVFTLTAGAISGGLAPATNYALSINLPAMVITGHKSGRSRRDRLVETLTLQSTYNINNSIILTNMKSTYAES